MDDLRERVAKAREEFWLLAEPAREPLPENVRARVERGLDAVLAAIDVAGREAKAREGGRREAAEAIRAHRDRYFPKTDDPNSYVNRVRRHLDIAIQVAGPPVTIGEAVQALARYVADGREECTCPDVDVSTLTDGPEKQRTVKGLDPECPEHGKGTVRVPGVPPPQVSEGAGPTDYDG